MDTKYSCPNCGQHIVVGDARPGALARCPNCAQEFTFSAQRSLRSSLASPWIWVSAFSLAVAVSIPFWMGKTRSRPRTPSNRLAPAAISIEQCVRDITNYDVKISGRARAEIKRHPDEAKPLLVQVVENPSTAESHRVAAATVLGSILPPDAPETKVLVTALRDKSNDLRWNSMRALISLNMAPQEILPVLAQVATDRNPMVRRTAAQFYGELGERAAEALPVLEILSQDENKAARDAANDAIAKVKPITLAFSDPHLTSAIKDLASSDPASNARARDSLGKIGAAAALELVALLEKGDASVKERGLAAEALGYTRENGDNEVQALITHVHKGEAYVRCRAMTSLGQLGIDPKIMVPLCIEMLDDKDASMRRRSAENLGRLGPEARGAVSTLARVKRDDKDGKVRSAAVRALAEIKSP